MLNFDLNQDPPTAEEIADERLSTERRIVVRKRYLWIGSIAAFISVVSFLVKFSVHLNSERIVVFIAAGVVAAITAGIFLDAFLDALFGNIENRLFELDDIAPSDSGQLVAHCLATPVCEDYRRKVAALGRKPVKAEAKMIREWVAEADGREKERCDDIAWGLVSSMESLSSDAVKKGDQKC